MFVSIDKRTLILQYGRKKRFLYETKASMSFIPMSGTSLWCLITKRKDVIRWFDFVLIDKWTLILKRGKKRFSYETKVSMSFILMSGTCLWCPITKSEQITIWIRVCPNWEMNINSKKWWKKKLFLWNQSINVIYPKEENKFVVPNHENKRDYYVNPCLFKLTNEI